MPPRPSRVLFLGVVLTLSAACELTPGSSCDGLGTDCGTIPVLCTDAEACFEPAAVEMMMCEETCDGLDTCAAELCRVECRDASQIAADQCYADHPCNWSEVAAETRTCTATVNEDARDCLVTCSDESAAQACVDVWDQATMDCKPSPFD